MDNLPFIESHVGDVSTELNPFWSEMASQVKYKLSIIIIHSSFILVSYWLTFTS